MEIGFKGGKIPNTTVSIDEAVRAMTEAQQTRAQLDLKELRKSCDKCKGMTDLEIIIFAMEWTLDDFKK